MMNEENPLLSQLNSLALEPADQQALEPDQVIDLIYEVAENMDSLPVLIGSLTQLLVRENEQTHSLAPHLETAVQLNHRFVTNDRKIQAYQAILDLMPFPLLLCNTSGKRLAQNQKMHTLLQSAEDFSLEQEQLQFNNPEKQALLEALLAGKPTKRNATLTGQRHDQRPVIVQSMPLDSGDTETADAATLLAFIDPDSKIELRQDLLKQRFGLSPTEIKIVTLLCEGHSVKEIAELNQNSPHTIKTQLRQVFEKTGIRQQTSLVQHFMASPAMVPDTNLTNDARISDPQARENTIKLANGRQLAYAEYGPETGYPVIFHHNFNGSRFQRPMDLSVLERCQVRLIVPDRPGFGRSDYDPHRTCHDWATDMTPLLDHLGIGKAAALAFGAGSPYAFSLAHHLPERINKVVLAGAMPQLTSINQIKAMHKNLIRVFLIARLAPRLLEKTLNLVIKHDDPEAYFDTMISKHLNEKDDALSKQKTFKEIFVRCATAAYQSGPAPLSKDILVAANEWHLDLSDLKVPVEIWHGEQDQTIGIEAMRSFSNWLPNTVTHFLEGEGHWLLYHHWEAILTNAVSD